MEKPDHMCIALYNPLLTYENRDPIYLYILLVDIGSSLQKANSKCIQDIHTSTALTYH
jgi:hypothetical protein